jgi:hypothetical protein
MPFNRTPARIGTLYFKYEDPAVDVTTEARTVEQETIDDDIVVQSLGRRADMITINAIVASYEAEILDDLTKQGVISLRTERWRGDVIVRNTDTSFMRAKDDEGSWLHEATIECIEVGEQEFTDANNLPPVDELGEQPDVRGQGEFADVDFIGDPDDQLL